MLRICDMHGFAVIMVNNNGPSGTPVPTLLLHYSLLPITYIVGASTIVRYHFWREQAPALHHNPAKAGFHRVSDFITQ